MSLGAGQVEKDKSQFERIMSASSYLESISTSTSIRIQLAFLILTRSLALLLDSHYTDWNVVVFVEEDSVVQSPEGPSLYTNLLWNSKWRWANWSIDVVGPVPLTWDWRWFRCCSNRLLVELWCWFCSCVDGPLILMPKFTMSGWTYVALSVVFFQWAIT